MLAILGAGKIGTAFASLLAKRSRRIVLYSIEEEVVHELNTKHTNDRYLPGIRLPAHVSACTDIGSAVSDADFVFIAVPTHAVASVLSNAARFLKRDALIVSITKGIDQETLEPLILHQARILPASLRSRTVLLGGPAIASEFVTSPITGLIAASRTLEYAETVRRAFEHASLRISTSTDVIGVGLSSSLKNVYSIALGICDGLEFSANAKALIFTCAIQEMCELVAAAGGNKMTVLHLAGVGDLYVSGHSMHSQNRAYGERLARQSKLDPHSPPQTIEGIVTLESALKLAKQHRIRTPLLAAVAACMHARTPSAKPFHSYLSRLKC